MPKKVLITGANGFIGSTLCQTLQKEGFDMIGLVRKTSNLAFLKNIDIKLVFGDINDISKLSKAIGHVETIYHIAGLTSDWGDYENFHSANVMGTLAVLKFAKKVKAKKTVILSSLSVMGFNQKAAKESDLKNKSNTPYVISKLMMEETTLNYARKNKLKVTILRPGDVYGPHDKTTTIKLLQTLEAEQMGFINGGKALLSPLHIDNLIQAIKKASNPLLGNLEIYNITDDIKINWKRFITLYCQYLKIKEPYLDLPLPLASVVAMLMETIYKVFKIQTPPLLTSYRICHAGLDYDFDISKAKHELNYKPNQNIHSNIRETIQWYNLWKKKKKKVFITGGTGLWGFTIAKHLVEVAANTYDIFCSYRQKFSNLKGISWIKVDLRKMKNIDLILKKIQPDIIIHTAAISKIQDCLKNPAEARLVNIKATKRLMHWANHFKAKLIFFSTDLVYGKHLQGGKLHSELEQPSPRYIYEKTKIEAEKAIQDMCYDYIILRVALTYGASSETHASFLDWILNDLKMGKQIRLFTDQIRTPISTHDGVRAIKRIMESSIKNEVINFGGVEKISRYDFGLILAKVFKFNKKLLVPVTYNQMKAKIPLPNQDTSMNIEKLKRIYPHIRTIKKNLKQLSNKIKQASIKV